MEPDAGERSTPHTSRKLVAIAAAAGAALLIAGAGSSTSSSVELMAANPAMHIVPNSQSEKLYDIPNFVYERTQTHFPEAEEGWLNMAAAGKIGDDVKPERTLNKLNDVISQARTHGLTENYEARVKAKTLAMTENYNEYDVTKGRVKNKFYDAEKAVQGGSTLKQKAPATLKQAKLAQLASLDSVGAMAAKAHALAAQGQAAVSSGEAAVRSGAASIERNLEGLKQQVVQSLSKAPSAARKQLKKVEDSVSARLSEVEGLIPSSSSSTSSAAAAPVQLLKVQVPAGLQSGAKFLANAPGGAPMLVTVPSGVKGGEWVAVKPPALTEQAVPVLKVTHPGADAAIGEAIDAHYEQPAASGKAAMADSLSEHNAGLKQEGNGKIMGGRDSITKGTTQLTQQHPHTVPNHVEGGMLSHPGATAAIDGALDAHYTGEAKWEGMYSK